MDVLILHKYPELFEPCCDLINSEWPRSKTARLRGLECSCDSLPTCLVLVEKNLKKGNVEVIGHSKISRIPAIPTGGFIESVVIRRDLRGCGLGRLLMSLTEDHMKSLGLSEAYLSTYDQQAFYTKLGYKFCERVSIYGAAISLYYQEPEATDAAPPTPVSIVPVERAGSIPPPPPPPPLPKFNPKIQNTIQKSNSGEEKQKKDFMNKKLLP